MSNQSGEAQLLEQAVAGNNDAMEQLIALHHAALLRFVNGIFPPSLKGWLEPSDILQETYTVAFRKIAAFHPDGDNAFYRWLATIARSRIVDQVRAAQRFKRRGDTLSPQEQMISDVLNQLAIYKRTPSQSAAGHELAEAVERSIEMLPEDYRQMIRLRHDEQLSPPEAAQRMKRTLGSAQMIYNRALKSLREKLRSASFNV